jgi:hypothetical protein
MRIEGDQAMTNEQDQDNELKPFTPQEWILLHHDTPGGRLTIWKRDLEAAENLVRRGYLVFTKNEPNLRVRGLRNIEAEPTKMMRALDKVLAVNRGASEDIVDAAVRAAVNEETRFRD